MADDPVVAQKGPYQVELKEGQAYFYCTCGRSAKQPFCDGSHAVTNVQPFILELKQPETIAICRCWKSKDHPYCDGTHGRLVKPKERPPRQHG